MLESELLFTEVLQCSRTSLYLDKGLLLNRKQSKAIASALKKRINGYPLQYILGKAEFMGLEFKVTPAVLIPRPETEILVEKVVEIARASPSAVRRILDVGTGSGCIAITLAKLLPGVTMDAVDISGKALAVARENAKLNGARVNFMQSDLFGAGAVTARHYDLIVSNPPYVAHAQFSSLQTEVLREPLKALYGGRDGLDFYRRIINGAEKHLSKNGSLVMEMGFGQKEAIEHMICRTKKFAVREIVKDYNGIDRVILAEKYNG
jgi:release factor glutamine methyltransferase